MRQSRFFSILAPAAAVLAFAAPGAALADGYDMDCKLLLCLPGGFPDGCGDALDHMVDRIRDGKSPIGTCAMSGGGDYDDYDVDYAFNDATSREGWQCAEGASLYHAVSSDSETGRRNIVNVFCYESSNTVRIGDQTRTYYTNVTRPERTDLTVDMTMNTSAETPYETGVMRFSTGRARDWTTRIQYTE